MMAVNVEQQPKRLSVPLQFLASVILGIANFIMTASSHSSFYIKLSSWITVQLNTQICKILEKLFSLVSCLTNMCLNGDSGHGISSVWVDQHASLL